MSECRIRYASHCIVDKSVYEGINSCQTHFCFVCSVNIRTCTDVLKSLPWEKKTRTANCSAALLHDDQRVRSNQVRHSCMVCGHLFYYCHCLGGEGLTHLTSPILSAYPQTPSSFQLFSNVISDGETHRTIHDSIRSLRAVQVFKASTFVSLMQTSSHLLWLLMASSHLRRWLPCLSTPSPSTGVWSTL